MSTSSELHARAMAMVRRPLFTVRKQSSGYTSSEKWIVVRRGGTRVTVHAHHHRSAAQADADRLNVSALVLDYADDPRPYDVRIAEAEAAYAAAKEAQS